MPCWTRVNESNEISQVKIASSDQSSKQKKRDHIYYGTYLLVLYSKDLLLFYIYILE
jgi:hypothetical protein